ncbi:MAG: tRNA uridine-5-carboxymethylaminomethyl(34) synthesis GTPase MnmE [Oscillospiraceae bacterium]|nr:tRNA uridine-5-carboxymethylaminomethyl(34) synthesis GTPase MnmE [Oscillospiraceae bacterium]
MSDTIAAIATGAQVAAIGIIRMSGDGALRLTDALFHPADGRAMSGHADRSLVYGGLRDRRGELLDLCLCTVSRAPHSYTGEDTAEFQCHGSPVVLRTALEELFALGARQAGPGEFTKRAFLNGRMELCSAEAVADIIDAESAEAARNAAGQLSGAIGAKIHGIYSALADMSSHYHAVLDYPDEDIEDFRIEAYAGALRAALGRLRALLDTFDRGRLMNTGIPAAIVGRPNAGKSSLLNALLGYDRAIVTSVPGTTRDTIEEKLCLGGLCLRLIDTAGIRESGDEAERLGVARSRAALDSAALVIVLVDGSAEYTAEDAQLVAAAERAPHAVIVLSKNDLEQTAGAIATSLPVVSVSAVTGEGLEELERAIAAMFPLPSVPAGEILTNARQAEAVKRAAEYMSAALGALEAGRTPDIVLTETEGAMAALGELTGRTVREDVTERIFEHFCVGK